MRVCYFLIGKINQDINEGSQECLLWRMKDPENPFCKVIIEPSNILGRDNYVFDGDKARRGCICCEKDSIQALKIALRFKEVYAHNSTNAKGTP